MAFERTTDDEDLRLNTLHRFAKRSPSLLLQEYSHCEVPAGCGGVVLRWLDPRGGIPVLVQLASMGTSETWLDGTTLSSSHVTVGAGRHVIAVHLSEVGTWRKGQPPILPAPFSIGVVSDAMGATRDLVRTATDVRWRWSARLPPLLWVDANFDDARWPALGAADAQLLATVPSGASYSYERAVEHGQAMFEILTREAWIRLSFTIEATPTPTNDGSGGAR